MKPFSRRPIGAVAAVMACAIATMTLPAIAAPMETNVSISGYAFSPETVTVDVGDTVTFVNDADETHTVTTYDSSFDSGKLQHKGTFSFRFLRPGTYLYYCRIHPEMHGTIVVIADPPGQ